MSTWGENDPIIDDGGAAVGDWEQRDPVVPRNPGKIVPRFPLREHAARAIRFLNEREAKPPTDYRTATVADDPLPGAVSGDLSFIDNLPKIKVGELPPDEIARLAAQHPNPETAPALYRKEIEQYHAEDARRRAAGEPSQEEQRQAVETIQRHLQSPQSLAENEQANVIRNRERLRNSSFPNLQSGIEQAGAGVLSLGARTGLSPFGDPDAMIHHSNEIEAASASLDAGGGTTPATIHPPMVPATDDGGAAPAGLERNLRGAIRSLGTAVPAGIIGGPAGAIAVGAADVGNRAITEGKDAGLTGGRLAAHVGIQGGLEAGIAAIFQAVGMPGMEGVFGQSASAGLRQGLKQAGKSVLEELPEEVGTELLQAIGSKLTGADPNALTPAAIKQTISDTVLQTLIATGAASVPNVVSSTARGSGLDPRAVSSNIQTFGTWVNTNPEAARALAKKENPTRKDFIDAGLAPASARERAEFAGTLRGWSAHNRAQRADRKYAESVAREVMSEKAGPPRPKPGEVPVPAPVPTSAVETPPVETTPEPTQQAPAAAPAITPTPAVVEQPAAATPAPKPTAQQRTPDHTLAESIKEKLDGHAVVDAKSLFDLADKAYGGTRAAGTYGPSDAYDALETGVNLHLVGKTDPTVDAKAAKQEAFDLRSRIVNVIPSQTNRSGEKNLLQQFSTPPDYAYVATWLANLKPSDIVLEPSAGVGGIAVHAKNSGAKVYGNEISQRRANLLRTIGLDGVFTQDAEQVSNVLPGKMPAPTAIIMNPPFSRAGERMGDKMVVGTDLKHIDQALSFLAPGGRLVAIIGAGLHGQTKTFTNWYNKTAEAHDFRANIAVGRDVYKGYGTTFPTRLLVIDKTSPTHSTRHDNAANLDQLIDLLEGVRNDRQYAQSDAAQQTGEEAVGQREGGQRTERELPAATRDVGSGEPGPARMEGGVSPTATGSPQSNVEPAGRGNPKPASRQPSGRGKASNKGSGTVAENVDRGNRDRGSDATSSDTPAAKPAASGSVADAGSIDIGSMSEADLAAWIAANAAPPFETKAAAPLEPAKPTIATKAAEAKQEFADAVGDLKKYLDGMTFSNPFADPKLFGLVANVTAKAIKSGIYTFAEYAQTLKQQLGEGMVRLHGDVFRHVWDSIAKADTTGKLDSSVPLDEVFNAPQPAPAGAKRAKVTSGDGIFEAYHAADMPIKGAQPHPGFLVESAAMAAVESPAIAYKPKLDQKLIDKGAVSDVQLEAVSRAGQAHQRKLPDGSRGAFMDGDGTGVGKGRTIAAIILDNINQGRKKALWVTKNQDLLEAARRDWKALGRSPDEVFTTAASEPIDASEGVLFMTYDTLPNVSKSGLARIDQVVNWLGKDFDGAIVFDEAHLMAAGVKLPGSQGDPSQRALAGIDLQKQLPNARISYFSATSATEVHNLAYAERLGLWGQGTPFANVLEFVSKISDKGVSAMELVARDMKAFGLYVARSLGFNDGTEAGTVRFERLQHTLTEHDRAVYNKMADTWQIVFKNMTAALGLTGSQKNGRAVSRMRALFYASQLRFFNTIITSMQIPKMIEQIERDMAEGRSAVIQITETGAAALTRAEAKQTDANLDELDLSPKEMLIDFVRKAYPVQQYEEYADDNGNVRTRPVFEMGSDGKPDKAKPVLNREAMAQREALIADLDSIRLANETPIDQIINHFGHEKVAEVTSRGERVVLAFNDAGKRVKAKQKRSKEFSGKADIAAFMEGKKRILIFSEAGGTGASYHADRAAKNQQQRSHYLLQAGWKAAAAMQGLGRTHRTNQASAPIYWLVHTDLRGQKRFISTIARRLSQLGALTRGQKETTSGGLFTETDNLESREAKTALFIFLKAMAAGEVEGITLSEFQNQTALDLSDDNGQGNDDKMKAVDIPQFLNRVLAMRVDEQNAVFDAFERYLADTIDLARQSGTLDTGVETIRAESIEKVSERVIHTHEETGAETRLVELKLNNKVEPYTWPMVLNLKPMRFARTPKGKLVAVVSSVATRRDKDTGEVHPQVRIYDQERTRTVDEAKANAYPEVPQAEAEDEWGKHVNELPATRPSTIHVITGVLLPIWDRVASGAGVKRGVTIDGEGILGRQVNPAELSETLHNLGITASGEKVTHTAASVHAGLLDGTYKSAQLANGWNVKAVRVQGERRIELIGPDFTHRGEMQRVGVFQESIQSRSRWFIPSDESGVETLGQLTKTRPIVDVEGEAEHEVDAMAASSWPTKATEIRLSHGSPSIPVSMVDTNAAGVSNHDIIATMAREFKVPIRAGKVSARGGLLGVFKRHPEVIRMVRQASGDLGVAAHEVAHAISKRTEIRAKLPLRLRRELGKLDYEPKKARPEEGWAEYFRQYLTHDDRAQSLAPEFTKWFEGSWLPANPKYRDSIERIKSRITQWRDLGPKKRVETAISFDGKARKPLDVPMADVIRGKASRATHLTYQAMKDEGHLINQFTKDAIARGAKFRPGDSPVDIYGAFTKNGATFANTAIENGVFLLTGRMDKIGPSLIEVFEGIKPEEYKDWVSWVVARHAIEVWGRKMNPGISLKDAQSVYNANAKNKAWEKAARKFKDFNDSLIEMMADAGVISDQAAKAILESWETYIPLMRVQNDPLAKSGRIGGRKLVDLSSPLHRRFGSGLQVLDPVMATIERAVRFYERAAQQQVIAAVIETANKTPGMIRTSEGEPEAWVESLPPGLRKTTIAATDAWPAIGRKLVELGLLPETIDGKDTIGDIAPELADELISIWRPDLNYSGNQPIARYINKGKAELYQFDPDFFRGINGMNHFQLPFFLDMTFGKATRAVKLGATGLSVAFGSRNPIHDYITWLMQRNYGSNTPRGLAMPAEMIASFVYTNAMHLAGKKGNPFVELWKELGGELSTSLGLDRKVISRKIQDVIADGTQRRILNIVKHPVDMLRSVIGVSEVGPRLAEFRGALEAAGYDKKRLLAGDMPPRHVLVEAVNAAHDVTVNFKRMGYIGKWINQINPFWNAATEGGDKLIRTWKDNPKRTAIRMLAMASATVAWWYSVKDEDWYNEAPPWLKYGFFTFSDDEGKPTARIPRGHEWGWLAAGIQATLDAIEKREPNVIAEYGKQAADSTLPWNPFDPIGSVMPALFLPAYEVATNEDTFTHRPIVNDRQKKLPAVDQHSSYNAELSVAMAQYLGVSPAKLEHLLEGYTGGLYGNVVRPTEKMIQGREPSEGDKPIVGAFQFRRDYSQSTQDFYTGLAEAEKAHNGAKANGKLDVAAAKRWCTFNEYADLMTQFRKADVGEGRDERFESEKYIIGLARDALGKPPIARYPNPLTAPADTLPADVLAARNDYVSRLKKRLREAPPKRGNGESSSTYQDRKEKDIILRQRTREILERIKS